jgi:hypothetical protein
VAQLVQVLRYKPEGRAVRFPKESLEFFIDIILLAALGPGVDSASNTNEYQKCFLGGKGGRRDVEPTTLSPSCADCLEMWEPEPPANIGACSGIALAFDMLNFHASVCCLSELKPVLCVKLVGL